MSDEMKKRFKKAVEAGDKEFRTFIRSLSESDVGRNGADLEHEAIQEYVQIVRGYSTFLREGARFQMVPKTKGKINRLHIGTPITQAADSGDDGAETGKALLDSITYDAKKVRTRTITDVDALLADAVGKDSLEEAILSSMQRRVAIDLELLAFNGDTTAFAADTSPLGKLLKTTNGWINRAQQGRVLDAGGAVLSEDLLEAAMEMYPEESDNGAARWIGNTGLFRDFKRLARAKGYDLSSRAYTGKSSTGQVAPIDTSDVMGYPYIPVGGIAKSKPVTSMAATPAQIKSAFQGPFQVTTSNNKMILTMDGGSATTITFTTGLRTASQLAAEIIAALPGIKAQDWEGFLLLTSPKTGSSASNFVVGSVANSIYATLGTGQGIEAGVTTTGADANVGGNIYEGTDLLLTDPQNLICTFVNEMRFTQRYDDDNDAIKIVLFQHVDFLIENPDACVLIKNIRKQRLAP